MKLKRVTLTGVDSLTSTGSILDLHHEFPFSEFGVLLSKTREGFDPRYPSKACIDVLLSIKTRAPSINLRLAGHLCGEWAMGSVKGPFLWAIQRNWQFQQFDRLQLNGVQVLPSTVEMVDRLASVLEKGFILQVKNFGCLDSGFIQTPQSNVSFLMDNSGGAGIQIFDLQPIPTGFSCGYAGGIGPTNIRDILERLTSLPGCQEFSIDMESGIRTENWFDVAKARECLRIAQEFVKK
jgi:hypothetical protein